MNNLRKIIVTIGVFCLIFPVMNTIQTSNKGVNEVSPEFPLKISQSSTLVDPYYELAMKWAPYFYQEIDEWEAYSDYITAFDFDGDFIGNNNWENCNENADFSAYIYYSVVETESHYFLGYYVYHPRDWERTHPGGGEHENDMEGVMIVLKKTDGGGESFVCITTEAHGQLYTYKNNQINTSKDITDKHGDLEDSNVKFVLDNHVAVDIEAKGHGVYCDKHYYNGFPEEKGINYYPSDKAQAPSSENDPIVFYELISIDILWSKRLDSYGSGYTFGRFDAFDGDTHKEDSANPPWGWDDPDDGGTFTGEIFYNPAQFTSVRLSGLGDDFSFEYVYNPYVVSVDIKQFQILDDVDKVEVYFNLFMFDGQGRYRYGGNSNDGVLDGDSGTQLSWSRPDSTEGYYYTVNLDHPLYGIAYIDNSGKFYPLFGIICKEWNEEGPDDWLMADHRIHWYGLKNTPDFESNNVENINPNAENELRWEISKVKLDLKINVKPETPSIEGPTSGIVGNSYIFTISGIDTDGDDIYFHYFWDNPRHFTETGLYSTDSNIKISKNWGEEGSYTLTVFVIDRFGHFSDSNTFTIGIKKLNRPPKGLF